MTSKTLSTVFVLFLFLLPLASIQLIAQQASAPPPPKVRTAQKRTPGATVRGRLIYEDSGAPIRYAMVGFTATGSRGNASRFVRTDEQGDFVYKDLAAGEYYPVVKDQGILNPSALFNSLVSQKGSKAKLETMFQKIVVEGVGEFDFVLRAKRGASISGVVRYFDGEPAVGVKVEAIPIVDGSALTAVSGISRSVGSEKTDDTGFYRFTGLVEGQYAVRVTEPVSHRSGRTSSLNRFQWGISGSNPFHTFFPSGSSQKLADRLDAFYGQTAEGINVTLPERTLYDVSGMVVRKDTGEPLKNFSVTFVRIEDTEDGDGKGNTNALAKFAAFAEGPARARNNREELTSEWSLLNLPAGKYSLTAAHQTSSTRSSKTREPQRKYPRVSKEIEITDGNLENVIIEIPVGSSMSGVIVTDDGRDLRSFFVLMAINMETREIVRSSGRMQRDASAQINSRKFGFESLSPGEYELHLRASGFYIRSVSAGSSSENGGVIRIDEGQDVSNVRVVLSSDMATIRGRITNFRPPQKVMVLLIRTGDDIVSMTLGGSRGQTALVKPDGTFELKPPPGEYSILVMDRSTGPRSERDLISWVIAQRENAPTVRVAAKEFRTLNLEIPPQSDPQ